MRRWYHLLSTEATDSISTGSQYTRAAKTAQVAEIEPSYRHLDICVEPGTSRSGFRNCSRCWKCARTMVTLEALGKLDR